MSSATSTFVDTNVLVYAHDATEIEKQPIARAIIEELWEGRSGVLSTQVLQEFYVVATRKLSPPMARAEARELVALYATWRTILIDASLVLDASVLEEQAQMSFWDALIVGAALRAGAARLISEDLGDGRRIDGLGIENPFGGLS